MTMKRIIILIGTIISAIASYAQINTDQVLRVGQNALYFEDYMLSIQYFNRVIQAKPYLAQPYFYRAIAKLNLEDYLGAEADASLAIERNPYLTDAWEVRGVARQNLQRNADAITDYDHALELLPRNRQLLFNKALAQYDIERYDAADSTFTALLTYYPGFDSGYLGRARLNIARGDTVAAEADINHAIEINPKAANAYIMRADIAIHRNVNDSLALADMNEAIKLMPRAAGLYVNRAYLRYRADDYFGAFADFDYALQLDPINEVALSNRAMLLMETGANDKALVDLNRLLELRPNDANAHYNRALVNKEKGLYKDAIADINFVIDAAPDLPEQYYVRASIYRAMGDLRRAEADGRKARQLAIKLTDSYDGEGYVEPSNPEEEAAHKFHVLTTIDDNAEIQEEYNNTAIRGKVQDRNLQIEPEGWMEIAYYAQSGELRNSDYYIKEVDELNAKRILPHNLIVTPAIANIDNETGATHFRSIEYYNSYLSTHTPRAIDYIARAMDFMTLRDYAASARDLDRAIALTPDAAIGYILRAQARYHNWQLERNAPAQADLDLTARNTISRKALDDILADLNRAAEISPRTAEVWYNKAIVHIAENDYTSALAALNQAIDLKPEMGEAWYNRGYIYLKLGNERAGISDLSRAGQLGILPAYNLIKRITQ